MAGTEARLVVYSIPEFCRDHRMSRTLFYDIQRKGEGPRVMRVRGRRYISAEAAAEWRKKMEGAA